MKYPKINIPEGAGAKAIKAGIVLGIAYLIKKGLEGAAKKSADQNLDTDPAAGQARALNAAMNPSGVSWMRAFDGTSDDAIYTTAEQISNLDKVQDYYKAQTTGRILFDDLTSEIGADGLQKFLGLASKGKTGDKKFSKVRTDIPTNKIVFTTAEANIRKTPKLESRLLPFNNIVRLVPKGRSLGVSTGKFAYDEKSDVTFIEFFNFSAKSGFKTKVYFYVAKSQVEYISVEEKKKRDKSGNTTEVFQGLDGINYNVQTQAVSLRPTLIYDENFKQLFIAPRNIIIGFPNMTLNTNKGVFIRVQTIDGNIRWVEGKDIRIEKR